MLKFTWKDAKFLSKAVGISVLAPVLLIGTWARCVDWSGPEDDLPATKRAHMEECAREEHTLGPDFLKEHPDCAAYVHPPASAKTAARH